jgi:hypothetical protein
MFQICIIQLFFFTSKSKKKKKALWLWFSIYSFWEILHGERVEHCMMWARAFLLAFSFPTFSFPPTTSFHQLRKSRLFLINPPQTMALVQASPAPSTKPATPIPPINGTAHTVANGGLSPSLSELRRIEVDGLMTEFRNVMGANWDRYRDVITHFLTGTVLFNLP